MSDSAGLIHFAEKIGALTAQIAELNANERKREEQMKALVQRIDELETGQAMLINRSKGAIGIFILAGTLIASGGMAMLKQLLEIVR